MKIFPLFLLNNNQHRLTFQYIKGKIITKRMLNDTINQTITNSTAQQTASASQVNQPENQLIEFLLYHAITIVTVLIFAAAILINNLGTKKNMKIAVKTKNLIHNFLKHNFTHYSGQLIDEAPNIIKLYASGRQSCIFAIFAFALVPRHQIGSLILNPIFFNMKDELVIQVPIKTSLNITLAIVRKKNIREITKKKYPDIKTLCKEYKPTNKTIFNVPDTHAILVEKKQHVPYLLATQKQVQVWNQYAKLVKLVYLSDINKFSRYPMALRMVINLPEQQINKNKGHGLLALLDWMIGFVDRMSKVRMALIDKRQAKKRRQGIDNAYDQF